MVSWKRTLYAAWVAQILSISGFSFVFPFMPLYIRELRMRNNAEVVSWAGVAAAADAQPMGGLGPVFTRAFMHELWVQDDADVVFWAGVATAATALPMAFFAPVWGGLADRFGRKSMVLRSMLGGAVVLTMMGFCQNVWQLVACRFLQGVLTGTVTASVALVASVTPKKQSGYALGMMHAALLVGVAIGPLLGGWLTENYGFRMAFVLAGALLLAGGLLMHFCAEEEFRPPAPAERGGRGTFAEVLAVSGFLAAVFALFTIQLANTAPSPVFPLFVEQIQGTREKIKLVTGAVVSVGGFAAAFSAVLFGRFSDSWGHKRVLVATSLFAGIVSVLHAFVRSIWQLVGLRTLLGLGAAGMMPAANAIIRDITHEKNLGKAFGVTSCLSCLGMALGPLAGSALAGYLGLRSPFILTGLVLGLAAALVLWRVKGGAPAAGPPPEPSNGEVAPPV